MRAVVQRVRSASVHVDGQVVSSIGPGLVCLVGVREGDQERDAEYICKKLLKTRMFSKQQGERAAWEEDVVTRGGEVLLVSQFTLYARLKKPRPDFSKAMSPQVAREFYQQFVERVQREYDPSKVKEGIFGAMMEVSLVNDGPVTFIIDSDDIASPATN